MLGLADGQVIVAPYDPAWPEIFSAEAERIGEALGDWVLDIQHVGSTAVPGLAAKPIIDIAVAVDDFELAHRCVAPLLALGYIYLGENGIPRRHYFHLGRPRRFHLHMNEIAGPDWRRQICFRDHLRHRPAAARAYEQLKRELARQFPRDRDAYVAGKGSFVGRALQAAGCES